MPILLGIRYITVPAGLDFTKESDYISNYFGKEKYSKGNVYCFFTFFFIPIIPLYCKQSVRMNKDGKPLYKREVSNIGSIINQLFGIVGVFAGFILFGMVASVFSGGHIHITHL